MNNVIQIHAIDLANLAWVEFLSIRNSPPMVGVTYRGTGVDVAKKVKISNTIQLFKNAIIAAKKASIDALGSGEDSVAAMWSVEVNVWKASIGTLLKAKKTC